LPDELEKAGLVKRDFPSSDEPRLLDILVDPENVVTEMGETSCGDEAYMSGSNHGDSHVTLILGISCSEHQRLLSVSYLGSFR
jgi:hypothetical protein